MMKDKGLCRTCNSDKECIFTRRFPVLYCEEFSDYVSHKNNDKSKVKNTHYSEVATEAE
jgi:hypothetical protein